MSNLLRYFIILGAFIAFTYASGAAATEQPADGAQITYITNKVVCAKDKPEGQATYEYMPISSSQDGRGACPDGTIFVGYAMDDELIETMWDIPVPPPNNEEKTP